jgi:hypothetical protein
MSQDELAQTGRLRTVALQSASGWVSADAPGNDKFRWKKLTCRTTVDGKHVVQADLAGRAAIQVEAIPYSTF